MTLTKSWLQKQITDLEATRDEIPFGLDEDGNNTLAALKLALAGMEAVPVVSLGLLSVQKARPLKSARKMLEGDNCDGCTHYSSEICHGEKCAAPQPLTTSERAELENYRNAQQVVPGEATSDDCPAFIKYDVTEVDEAWARGFNACRAGMLQAGNSPVIPDGWVACSERMPEDATWCAVNTEYGYYVQCWSDGQGWLGDEISIPNCDVTHWMPLPAAPQQEA